MGKENWFADNRARSAQDAFGESFQFNVNNRLIFAKGANWIPAHSFVTEASPEMYKDLMNSAAAVGMNMLRV